MTTHIVLRNFSIRKQRDTLYILPSVLDDQTLLDLTQFHIALPASDQHQTVLHLDLQPALFQARQLNQVQHGLFC